MVQNITQAVYPQHNLPPQPTPFIGRTADIIELVSLLNKPDCRLLTLLGPGGIGKTRLSLQVASRVADNFEHGIYYVPLAPLTDDDDIPATMISVLGIRTGNTRIPREQLVEYLVDRCLLLIIDNFEHLLDGVDLVIDILRSAPNVKILATSRAVLNLREEWVWHVKGLSYPDETHINGIEDYSALQLFLDRAQRVRYDFSLQHDKASVIRICQLVDGLPLAIELATSWLKVLTCAEIGAEIQRSIVFLTSNVRNIPERHRSIQAVFDHSWNLCTADEQAVFCKLCIFRGGFERESAEMIAGATLLTLSGLVEKSIVKRLPSGRYEIQELLRQYAQEKLNGTDELTTIQTAHMRFYADFMQARTPDIKGRRQLDALNEIKADFENIRTAWHRAIVDSDYLALDQMMEGLALYCDMHARYSEGYELFKKAVDELASENDMEVNPVWNRLRVRWIQVWVLPELKDVPDVIRQQLDEGFKKAEEQEDRDTIGVCLWLLGELERISHNLLAVHPLFEQAMAYYKQLDDDYYVGRILRVIVYSLHYGKETDKDYVHNLNLQHIQLTRSMGDRNGLAHALLYETNYVDVRIGSQGLEEAIAIWREIGDWKSVGITLSILSRNLLLNGQFDRAKQMAFDGEQLQHITGWRHGDVDRSVASGIHAIFSGDLQAGQLLNASDVAQLTYMCGDDDILELVSGIANTMLAHLNPNETEQYILSALKLVREPFSPLAAAGCLPVIAMIVADDGETEKAVQLLGLAFIYADHFLMGWMTHWQRLTRLREQLQTEMGDEAYNSAWEQGAHLDLEDTIGELLVYFGAEPIPSANQALIEPLTERELEVLAFLVEGYSNPKIAEELTVVVGTVKSHVYNICQKLGADNRTQAAVIARERKLI